MPEREPGQILCLHTITIADYSCVCRVLRPAWLDCRPFCTALTPLPSPLQPLLPLQPLASSLVACLRPKRRRCRCHWRFMSTAAAAQYSNSLHSLITCRQLFPRTSLCSCSCPPSLPVGSWGRHQLLKRWTAKLCVRRGIPDEGCTMLSLNYLWPSKRLEVDWIW